ncbi:hypothetical protein C4546_04335 [Candidatus Parcubacteria bacterium]|nr:MAG: hypothetical protein C4546_04335 [Candidatus Parcubacteria bacterium]
MKKYLHIIVIFILLIVTIVFWEEYSFRKKIQAINYEKCLASVPDDANWSMLQEVTFPHCLQITK